MIETIERLIVQAPVSVALPLQSAAVYLKADLPAKARNHLEQANKAALRAGRVDLSREIAHLSAIL